MTGQQNKTQRIALYGGSFDPIHNGHLIVARALAETRRLERVILLPTASPPHKDAAALADSEHRRRMVELAIDGEPLFELSDHDLVCKGPSYTVDTVAHFRDQLGDDAILHWIIGADSLADLGSWMRVSELIDSCIILTAARPGWSAVNLEKLGDTVGSESLKKLRDGIIESPHIDISATDIRARLSQGLSARFLLPDSVLAYIQENRLYSA